MFSGIFIFPGSWVTVYVHSSFSEGRVRVMQCNQTRRFYLTENLVSFKFVYLLSRLPPGSERHGHAQPHHASLLQQTELTLGAPVDTTPPPQKFPNKSTDEELNIKHDCGWTMKKWKQFFLATTTNTVFFFFLANRQHIGQHLTQHEERRPRGGRPTTSVYCQHTQS